MKHPLLTLALSLVIATTACGQSMKKPDIKLNPDPKLRYEVTLTIDEDVPGPFESVTAYAYYETDRDCVPEQAISGAKLSVDQDVKIAFRPIAANTYQGVLYLDWFQDEDYYGLGTCRWKLVSFNVPMKAGEVIFGAALGGEEIASGKARVEYFPRAAYGNTSIPNWHVGGDLEHAGVTSNRNAYFSTTLTPKEAFQ